MNVGRLPRLRMNPVFAVQVFTPLNHSSAFCLLRNTSEFDNEPVNTVQSHFDGHRISIETLFVREFQERFLSNSREEQSLTQLSSIVAKTSLFHLDFHLHVSFHPVLPLRKITVRPFKACSTPKNSASLVFRKIESGPRDRRAL